MKDLMKRAAPSLRESLEHMLHELINGGFIQDNDRVSCVANIAIPRGTDVLAAPLEFILAEIGGVRHRCKLLIVK